MEEYVVRKAVVDGKSVGWAVHRGEETVNLFRTREIARWNAKRWNQAQQERAIFRQVYMDLFGS